MPFSADQTNQQITESMGAMLLLHASNQALIEATITPSSSPWYPVLDQELGTAENLVVGWRRNGFLYFQQDILQQIIGCGQAFAAAQPAIDALFGQLEKNFSAALKQQIVDQLNALDTPIAAMTAQLGIYLDKLRAFQAAMEGPDAQMNQSVAAIQAQEAQIAAQINAINTQMALLKQQVITDRQAIAKAKAARDRGIVETIFGVLLAPVTGGASLILAGIGVGTIAEAEEQVGSLEKTIAGYQSTIIGDQQTLSSDQRQVATLQGLTMSMSLVLSDIGDIESALGALRTTWGVLEGGIQNAAQDVARATSASEATIGQVWFDSACGSWQEITAFAEQLAANNAPAPTTITIGNAPQDVLASA